MKSPLSPASRLNTFIKKRFGPLMRPLFGTAPVRALVRFYYRWFQPAMRTVYPLFGAAVMIGLTYRCQCRCVHCGTVAHRDQDRKELDEEEVRELIRQASKLGAAAVYLFGGEPLLASGVLEIVRYAKSLGLFVTIDTNGLLLDREMARRLAEAGLDLAGVSVDSPDEAEHDALRGCPGAYRSALDAIRFCKEAGIEAYLSTYATHKSLRDGTLDRTIAISRSLGVKTRVISPLRAGRWLERDDVGFAPEDIKLLRSRLTQDVYWESIFVTSPEASFLCGCAARTYFYVSPYGDVQPCAYMPLGFGNVRKEPLLNIVRRMWGSAMFSSLDSSMDCPMNSPRFREVFGPLLAKTQPGARNALLASSPNDRAEWDAWAEDYGRDMDWLEEVHNPDIAALLAPAGKRVLDVGCGTGRRARALFAEASKLTAVDFSAGMAAVARKVLADLPNAEVLESDITSGGLPAGAEFDAVLAASVMHHIGDVTAALEQIKARMAPGAELLIVDSVTPASPAAALRYYFEMLRLNGPLRLASAFYKGRLSDSSFSRHKKREVPLTFEEFRLRYADLLPGAVTELRHGIFGYLLWKKP